MAIDPSIPLGFQPTTPAPNAANIFAVVAQMKQMQDQQQARERDATRRAAPRSIRAGPGGRLFVR